LVSPFYEDECEDCPHQFSSEWNAYQAAFDVRPYNNPDVTFNASQQNVAFGVQVFQRIFFFERSMIPGIGNVQLAG
jgi:hypothetical protein